jgi:hypothetical protein
MPQFELDSEEHIFPSVTTSDLYSLFVYEMWIYQLHGLADTLCSLSELHEKKTQSHATTKQIFQKKKE